MRSIAYEEHAEFEIPRLFDRGCDETELVFNRHIHPLWMRRERNGPFAIVLGLETVDARVKAGRHDVLSMEKHPSYAGSRIMLTRLPLRYSPPFFARSSRNADMHVAQFLEAFAYLELGVLDVYLDPIH